MKKILIIILIVISIAVIMFLYKEDGIVNDNVDVFTIRKENSPKSLRASGILIPKKIIEVRANQSGIIVEAMGPEGSNIDKGEILFRYDDDIAKADLHQAEANLMQAKSSLSQSQARKEEVEANVQLAKITLENTKSISHRVVRNQIEELDLKIENANVELERSKKLYNNNAIEKVKLEDSVHNLALLNKQKEIMINNLVELEKEKNNQIEEAEQSLKQVETSLNTANKDVLVANSAVQIAKSALNKAELLLKKYQLKSPISGIILKKNINEGEYVQPGQVIYSLSSNDFLVRISPDERELNILSLGGEAYISPEAYPDKKIKVVISRISPQINVERGTVDIYLELLEEIDLLLANMSVSVEFLKQNNSSGIYIPEKYIKDENSKEYVFVYQENKAVKRIINTGEKNGKGMVEVINGLNEGEKIINTENIEDKMEIEIQE